MGIGFALLAGILIALYWSTGLELVRLWGIDPNYSHGYLVPIVSVILIWRAWKHSGPPIHGPVSRRDVIVGTSMIGFGLAWHLLASVMHHVFMDVVSLVFVLEGVLLVLGGRDARRAYGFAAVFLLFMAPLPPSWYQPIAVAMQQLVSGISAGVLHVLQVPAYREGYIIQLPGYAMEVGAACSGLRQMTAFLALTAAVAHWSRRDRWYKATLVVLSVPIAIAANCLRVTLTAVILMFAGPMWAEGVFHTLEGLAVTGLGAVLVLGAAWALARIGDLSSGEKPKGSKGRLASLPA